MIPPFSSGLRTKPTLVSGTCVAESTSPTGEAASLLPYRRLREPAHHSNLRYCPAQRNTDMLICLCTYVNKRIVYSRPVACLRPDGCVCGRRRKRDACRGSETGIRVDVRRATQRLAEDPDLPCLQRAQEASEWLGTSRRVPGYSGAIEHVQRRHLETGNSEGNDAIRGPGPSRGVRRPPTAVCIATRSRFICIIT